MSRFKILSSGCPKGEIAEYPYFNGRADDGCQASERVYESSAHVHGNGRESLNHLPLRAGDGDVHPGHAYVGDDV